MNGKGAFLRQTLAQVKCNGTQENDVINYKNATSDLWESALNMQITCTLSRRNPNSKCMTQFVITQTVK